MDSGVNKKRLTVDGRDLLENTFTLRPDVECAPVINLKYLVRWFSLAFFTYPTCPVFKKIKHVTGTDVQSKPNGTTTNCKKNCQHSVNSKLFIIKIIWERWIFLYDADWEELCLPFRAVLIVFHLLKSSWIFHWISAQMKPQYESLMHLLQQRLKRR